MKKELILIDHCHRLLRDLELHNKKQRVFLREYNNNNNSK